MVKKNSVPPWNEFRQKHILLYRLEIYNSTYNKLKMRNTKKHDRHLGVLFFADIFRHRSVCRSPPFHSQKNGQEGAIRHAEKISNIFQNFDNFRKTSSPRYERENQALFTTAFMQRGGDPLWN